MTNDQFQKAVLDELGEIKREQGSRLVRIEGAITGTTGGKVGMLERLRSLEYFRAICIAIVGAAGTLGLGWIGKVFLGI
jgi:hypothetical protein